MTIGTLELQLRDQVLKRMMDIAGALVGCLISLPIIAIVAIPLKIESPGPLIFKQKRLGSTAGSSTSTSCAVCIPMPKSAKRN